MKWKTGIGQDSHRFTTAGSSKSCIVGGIIFEDAPGLAADSDGDVVLHSLCNAITSLTHVPILGGIAIDLCHKDGITDSRIYVEKALETLGKTRIEYVAFTIEGKRPKFQPRLVEMRERVAEIIGIDSSQVGITATSGDGLTDFGCGDGLQCFCLLTTCEV